MCTKVQGTGIRFKKVILKGFLRLSIQLVLLGGAAARARRARKKTTSPPTQSCRSDIYSDLSPSSVLFVRVGVRGDDVTKRVNARDENENNNTGFGVIRIQVASKSARAPLAGSDRYRYQYICVHSCTGTGTIMIDSLHPLLSPPCVLRSQNLPLY